MVGRQRLTVRAFFDWQQNRCSVHLHEVYIHAIMSLIYTDSLHMQVLPVLDMGLS